MVQSKRFIGAAGGFFIGLSGFLLLYKVMVLEHIPPEDEIPPGAVVAASVICGAVCAAAGSNVQRYFEGQIKNRKQRH